MTAPPLGEVMLAELVTLEVTAPAPVSLSVPLDPWSLAVTPPATVLTVIEGVQGPRGGPGPQGDKGDPGEPGVPGQNGSAGGNLTYTFSFAAAALIWNIPHGLARFPSVTVLDTAGDQIIGDLSYLDANTLQVAFSVPVAGVAYLN